MQLSLILMVPFVVARIETNILINPDHPDFSRITHGLHQPVWWDERLYPETDTGLACVEKWIIDSNPKRLARLGQTLATIAIETARRRLAGLAVDLQHCVSSRCALRAPRRRNGPSDLPDVQIL